MGRRIICYSDGGMSGTRGMYGSHIIYDVTGTDFDHSGYREEDHLMLNDSLGGDVTRCIYARQEEATNNLAESKTLLSLLLKLKRDGFAVEGDTIDIYLDSELVCNWIFGIYKIGKKHIREVFAQIRNVFTEKERSRISFWLIPGSLMKKTAIGH